VKDVDRFEDLRTFVAVCELGSVSGAAKALQRAPSAVSRRLAELEARLGAKLLARTTHRMALTGAGERFLERAKALLAELDDAEASVAAEQQALDGTLRVTLPLSFGLRYLCPSIHAFAREHPALSIDLDLTDRHVDLVRDGIDLGVRIGRLHDSSLRARRLSPIDSVVAAAPAFWDRHERPDSPDALSSLPALCYRQDSTHLSWAWTRTADDTSGTVRVDSRLRANNGDALAGAAIEGLGVVRLPVFILNDAILRGDLEPVLLDHTWGHEELHLVYPDTRYLPQRVRRLIDHLAHALEGDPPWNECLR